MSLSEPLIFEIPKDISGGNLEKELKAAGFDNAVVTAYVEPPKLEVRIPREEPLTKAEKKTLSDVVAAHKGGPSAEDVQRTKDIQAIKKRAETDPDFAALVRLLRV